MGDASLNYFDALFRHLSVSASTENNAFSWAFPPDLKPARQLSTCNQWAGIPYRRHFRMLFDNCWLLFIDRVIDREGTLSQYCYWTGRRVFFFFFFFFSASREFLSLQQNLAIASLSNFLSIFMTSIQSAVWNLSDLYGWPWCMTLTFQYFDILSHNSVPAGQNTIKFLLNVA